MNRWLLRAGAFLLVWGMIGSGASAQRTFLRIIQVPDQAQALQIIQEFEEGKTFAELARKYSNHPTAPRGGFLGEAVHSRLHPSFLEAIKNTPAGAVSAPFDQGGQVILLQPLPRGFRREAYGYEKEAIDLQSAGKHREALELFSKALEIYPDFIHVSFQMGVSYRELGEHAREIEAYRRALEVEPEYQLAHYNLGVALLQQGETQEGIRSLRRAVSIKPDYVNAWISLSGAYLSLGDIPAALEAAKQAVTMNPLRATAYYNLGAAQSRTDPAAALQSFRTAVALNESRPDYKMALAVTTGQLGRTGEAVELLKKIVSDHPEFTPARQMLDQLGVP